MSGNRSACFCSSNFNSDRLMRAFLLRIIALLLFPFAATAQDAATERPLYTVRIITIAAAEGESVRAAMNINQENEDAMLRSFSEQITSGSAELLSDSLIHCGEEKSQEARCTDEDTYCTEFLMDDKRQQLVPQSATSKNAANENQCRTSRDPNANRAVPTLT